MSDIAGGRDGPLFVAKLPDEHATGQLSPGLSLTPPPSLSSSSAWEAWLLDGGCPSACREYMFLLMIDE